MLAAILLLAFALHDSPAPQVRGIVVYSPKDVEVSDLAQAGLDDHEPSTLLNTRQPWQFIVLTPSVLPSIDKRALGFMYPDGAMLVGLGAGQRVADARVRLRVVRHARALRRHLQHGSLRRQARLLRQHRLIRGRCAEPPGRAHDFPQCS